MNTLDKTRSPAEVYDTRFVPALFAPWGPVVAAEAGVRDEQQRFVRGLREGRGREKDEQRSREDAQDAKCGVVHEPI